MATTLTIREKLVSVPLLDTEHRWSCPNCHIQSITHETRPHTQMHSCHGMAGLTVPLVPAGTRCKIVAVEREDYLGGENVQRDGNNRPIMAVITTRDDGQDCTVYAPVAQVKGEN